MPAPKEKIHYVLHLRVEKVTRTDTEAYVSGSRTVTSERDVDETVNLVTKGASLAGIVNQVKGHMNLVLSSHMESQEEEEE